MDVTHYAQCHCSAVCVEFDAPSTGLTVWHCNCSICTMKQNHHIVVPNSKFRCVKGESELSEYRFNTKKARHLFCKHCGVSPYYVPRSNADDGVGVNYYCVKPGTLKTVVHKHFDGQNWESFYASSSIQACSKPT